MTDILAEFALQPKMDKSKKCEKSGEHVTCEKGMDDKEERKRLRARRF